MQALIRLFPFGERVDAIELHIGAKGIVFQYGEDLALVDERGALTRRQFLHLYVFEVSDCAQGQSCGPGYHGQGGIRPPPAGGPPGPGGGPV